MDKENLIENLTEGLNPTKDLKFGWILLIAAFGLLAVWYTMRENLFMLGVALVCIIAGVYLLKKGRK